MRDQKFVSISKSDQVQDKTIRSNSGDNHGSGCPRKAFENVSKKCLFHLLNIFYYLFFMLFLIKTELGS